MCIPTKEKKTEENNNEHIITQMQCSPLRRKEVCIYNRIEDKKLVMTTSNQNTNAVLTLKNKRCVPTKKWEKLVI